MFICLSGMTLYTFIFMICLYVCGMSYLHVSLIPIDNLRCYLYTIGRKYKLLNASLDDIYFPGRLVHLHITWLRYKTKIIMDHLR